MERTNTLENNRLTYYGFLEDKIISELTVVINSNDTMIKDINELINDKTVYLTGFRTDIDYQNKGYFKKLYKFVEQGLKNKGYKHLFLGFEPKEVKNMMIYFKYGFKEYIKTSSEQYSNGEKIIVNYYRKDL